MLHSFESVSPSECFLSGISWQECLVATRDCAMYEHSHGYMRNKCLSRLSETHISKYGNPVSLRRDVHIRDLPCAYICFFFCAQNKKNGKKPEKAAKKFGA